jgi:hypothetical protein
VYIVVLLWIRDAESIVVTTLGGGELVYTLCCVPYPGPLPGRRKFPCYNFCDIPDFLIRFVLVSGVPCVGVVCLSKVSFLCVVNDRMFFMGTNLARW